MSTPADLLAVANRAVDLAVEVFASGVPGGITAKGDRDYATELDFVIEQRVGEFLIEHSPAGVEFVGEELGPDSSTAERWWVLDPIDGTVNYAHGVPLCGISLALIDNNQPVVGVIDLPLLGARYTAVRGSGAFCNNDPIQVSATSRIGDALVSIGDYAVGDKAETKNQQRLQLTALLAGKALRVRMFGTAAIDLAWLAHGRTDAVMLLSNNPWDVAAGIVIAQEAGAALTDLDHSPYTLDSRAVIGSGPNLTHELRTSWPNSTEALESPARCRPRNRSPGSCARLSARGWCRTACSRTAG